MKSVLVALWFTVLALAIAAFAIEVKAESLTTHVYTMKIEFRGQLEGTKKTKYKYTVRQTSPNVKNKYQTVTNELSSHDVTFKMQIIIEGSQKPQFLIILEKSKDRTIWNFWEKKKQAEPFKINTVGGLDSNKYISKQGTFSISFHKEEL